MIANLENKEIIVQEILSYEWLIKVPEETEIAVPEEFDRHKSVLIDYLKKHNGQKFNRELIQQLFEMSAEQIKSLAKMLEEKGVIQQVEICHGILNKDESNFEQLPKNLQKFQDILSSWVQYFQSDQESDIIVSRDNLPLHKDAQEGCRQIRDYLIGEEVIKEPALIFPKIKNATTKMIESEQERIAQVIKGLNIEPLYRKYCPAPAEAADDYKPNSRDYFFYRRAKNELQKYFQDVFKVDPTDEEEKRYRKWLKETKEKEALDAYVSQVLTAVTSSAGQLKTSPAVSASFRNLNEYFTSGRYPPEVDDFEVQLLDRVIVLNEYKSWWDWRAVTVTTLGVLQIAFGVAINCLSAGVLSPFGTGLIGEGVNDIMFAIQTGLTGTFSWSGYRKQKMVSAGITIVTAGLATCFTWSTAVAKSAVDTVRSRCGLDMLLAAGKKIGRKFLQATRLAFIALGVDKFMVFLKKLLVDNILKFIRYSISYMILTGEDTPGAVKTIQKELGYKRMSEAMDNIWKSTDGNVEESKRLIETTVLVDATASEMHSTWFNQLSVHSAQLGRAMGNTFAQASQKSQKYQSDYVKALPMDGPDSGLTIVDVSKMVNWTTTAMQYIDYLKTGTEVLTIITHAPEYINNIGRELENQAHLLEKKKESKRTIPKAQEEFEKFKSEMWTRVERDLLDHVSSRICSAWLQPLVQRKVEGIVKRVGKEAIQSIGSLFDDDDQEGLSIQREQVKEETEKKQSEEDKKKKNKRANNVKLLDSQSPDDVLYADQVNNIDKGQPIGLLECQQVVDYCGIPLELEDETRTPNSKDGTKLTVKPNGREPEANDARRLKMRQNEAGMKHVSLTDSNGKTVYEGSLYNAAARFKGVDPQNFISGLKSHAWNNDRTRYF